MKLYKLLPLIGFAILFYLLFNVDIYKVIQIITAMQIEYLLLSIPLIFLMLILKALKWKVIVHSYNISFSLIDSLKAWLIGFSLSIITPGKLGDFARSYYLKDKTRLGKSLTTVMADRIIDIVVLFVLSIIGLFLFFSYYSKSEFLLLITSGFFVIFLIATLAFSKKSFSSLIFKPFYKRFLPNRYKDKIKSFWDDFYEGISIMLKKKKLISFSFMITFVIWFVTIFYAFVLSFAFSLNISYWFLLIVMPIVGLILALPISFGGIGTREAAIIFFLSFIGITAEVAFSFSILMLIVDYMIGLIGFLIWLKNPIKISEKDKPQNI